MEWIVVDQDTVERTALVKVINLLVPQKAGNVITDRLLPSYGRLYSVELVERRTCLCSRYLPMTRLLLQAIHLVSATELGVSLTSSN